MEETNEVELLRTRLDRLERSQARMKRTMAAAIVAVAGLASVAATPRRLPVVDAREFRVVDATGKVRATLGPSEFR
jgi:hypothetical protein